MPNDIGNINTLNECQNIFAGNSSSTEGASG